MRHRQYCTPTSAQICKEGAREYRDSQTGIERDKKREGGGKRGRERGGEYDITPSNCTIHSDCTTLYPTYHSAGVVREDVGVPNDVINVSMHVSIELRPPNSSMLIFLQVQFLHGARLRVQQSAGHSGCTVDLPVLVLVQFLQRYVAWLPEPNLLYV